LLNNIKQADDAFGELVKLGVAPFNPVWSVYFGGAVHDKRVSFGEIFGTRIEKTVVISTARVGDDSLLEHEEWMEVDLAWVEVANIVLRLPGESVGADREVAQAIALGIPVFHTLEQVKRYEQERNAESIEL